MLKYKEFLDLTEEEIRFILTDIFHPVKIENIQKDPDCDEITAEITTGGWNDGESEDFEITDTVELTPNGINVDFSVDAGDRLKYKQFLLEKGCDYRLKNNPYINI